MYHPLGISSAKGLSRFFPLIAFAHLTQASVGLAEEMPRPFRSPATLGQGGAGMVSMEGGEATIFNPSNLAEEHDLRDLEILSPAIYASDDLRNFALGKTKISDLTKNPLQLIQALRNKDFSFGISNLTGAAFRQQGAALIAEAAGSFFLSTNGYTVQQDVNAQVDLHAGYIHGYGHELKLFGEKVAVGANAKVLNKQSIDVYLNGADLINEVAKGKTIDVKKGTTTRSGTGLGFDLAANWHKEVHLGVPIELKTALVLQNLGGMSYSGGKKAPGVDKQQINLGGGIVYKHNRLKAEGLLDIEDLFDANANVFFKRFHTGANVSYNGITGLRIGNNQGYTTYGAFVKYKFIALEYAKYTEETGKFPGDRPSKRTMYQLILGVWL